WRWCLVVCVPVALFFFFFSSRRRHTRSKRDWSSDVCSSDLRPLSVTVSSGSRTPRVGIEPGGPPDPAGGHRTRHRGGANRPGARAFCGHRTEANPTFRPLRLGAVTTDGESQARVSVDERLSL